LFQRIELPGGERLALDVTPPGDARRTSALYVHGLGSHRGGEKALFLERELVARGFGYARFDLRGHGDSDGRFEELTLSRQIEDLEAVLAHLGSGAAGAPPRRVLLIGASLGALTVAWRGVTSPRRAGVPEVVGQVLVAPSFRIVERYLDALGESGRERWRRAGVHRFAGPWFEFDLRFDVVTDSGRYPHERLLRETTLPTLILHGTGDPSAPLRLSEEFAAGCAGRRTRLVAIEGGDHRLTACKERLLAEIVRFADEVTGGELVCAS